ncbi:hypothetical protein [Sulfurirhabdus autotrophica]|uniref:hypothetical protein n=1 Tax=Sulfurirhabdus autotrophica TaxID=1706046 RepID=UPI000F615972|nr:hypothetical protein [Sulfurirhabdus autotrophica]
MNNYPVTAFYVLPNGQTPLAGTAATKIKLTQNNACAIVSCQLAVSVLPGKYQKNVRPTLTKQGIYRHHAPSAPFNFHSTVP